MDQCGCKCAIGSDEMSHFEWLIPLSFLSFRFMLMLNPGSTPSMDKVLDPLGVRDSLH